MAIKAKEKDQHFPCQRRARNEGSKGSIVSRVVRPRDFVPRGRTLNKCLAMTYFRMVKTTLSLALSSFTSEFGMGSGGSRSLLSPGKSVCEEFPQVLNFYR